MEAKDWNFIDRPLEEIICSRKKESKFDPLGGGEVGFRIDADLDLKSARIVDFCGRSSGFADSRILKTKLIVDQL